jgi:hypothetical protein
MNPTLMQDLAATIAADRRREADRYRAAAPARSGWMSRVAGLVGGPTRDARATAPGVSSPPPCGPSASSVASRAR